VFYSEQEKLQIPRTLTKTIAFRHRNAQFSSPSSLPESGTVPSPPKPGIVDPKPPQNASDGAAKPTITKADIEEMFKEIALSVTLDVSRMFPIPIV